MSAAAARPWSLTVRLGWRLAAVMLVAVSLTTAAVAWRVFATVHELDDSTLQAQVRLIAGRLPDRADPARPPALPDEVVAPFQASDGDNVFLIYEGDRLAIASDAGAAALLTPVVPPLDEGGFFRTPPVAGHANGMVGFVTHDGPWRIVVLQGREQSEVLLGSLMRNLAAGAVWLFLPIGLLMILVALLTLRRGLRPVRQVSAAAALIGPARPDARLPTSGLPDEVAPLVHAVNDALGRLDRALLAERHFMAEAAHALRTPLAVLTARLDLLAGHPEAAALRGDADRMGRLVGQLLGMARLEALPLDVSAPLDLHAVAVEAITGLVPLGLRRGVEIALAETGPLGPAAGNHAALVLAVGNLVENALAHAPPGSTVEVAIAPPATIAVRDRGPGVPEADRARIFGRFERGAAATPGGAGLGLAIVREIAAAHGGTVRAEPRSGGGASFILALGGRMRA